MVRRGKKRNKINAQRKKTSSSLHRPSIFAVTKVKERYALRAQTLDDMKNKNTNTLMKR